MNKIKFSVIIPTRERCRTLEHTIRTCVGQDYDNIEIIVSDNYSQDDTQRIVNSFNDPRIVYVNTGRRVSMSHNWEFALKHVSGDYVTFVGDDDGLLPGALKRLAEIIAETGTEAITWKWASYFWPDCILTNSKNLLFAPLEKRLERRATRPVLSEVLSFRRGYEELPFLYKGVVSASCIQKVVAASNGAFFHSMTPDLYSAIVLSAIIENYYFSAEPFSINGTSAQSNGASQFNRDISSDESSKFLSESNIPFHPKAAFCPSLPMLIAECLYQAKDNMSGLNGLEIDKSALIGAMISDAASSTSWRFDQIANALREYGQKHDLAAQVEAQLAVVKCRADDLAPPIGLTPGYNIISKHLIVDGSRFHIQNIYDASVVCGFILNSQLAGYSRSILDTARTTARLMVGAGKRLLLRRSAARAH